MVTVAAVGARIHPQAAARRVDFEAIYRMHGTVIQRFCLSQLRDPHLAEDATSDVFAIAIASHDRTRPQEEEILYWLLGIARKVVAGQRRGLLRRLRLRDRARDQLPMVADIHDQVETRAELRRVTEAMSQMGERDRTLIGLRCAAQLSYAEVAEVLDISEGTARVATHRALRSLRARLEATP